MDPTIMPIDSRRWREMMEQIRASQPTGRHTRRTIVPETKLVKAALDLLPQPIGRAAHRIIEEQRSSTGRAIDALPGRLGQQVRHRIAEDYVVVPHLGELESMGLSLASPNSALYVPISRSSTDPPQSSLNLTVAVPALKTTIHYESVDAKLHLSQVLFDIYARLFVDLAGTTEMPWLLWEGKKIHPETDLETFSMKSRTDNMRCTLVLPPSIVSRTRQPRSTTIRWNLVRNGRLLGGRGTILVNLQFSIAALISVLREDTKFNESIFNVSTRSGSNEDLEDLEDSNIRVYLDGVVLMEDETTLEELGIRKHSVISVEILQKTPFGIIIRKPDGTVLTKEVLYKDTIEVLKDVIARTTSIPIKRQRLWMEDTKTGYVRLSDERTLSDCNVNPGSTVVIEYLVDHHLLLANQSLSAESWKELVTHLPEQLRHDIEYNERFNCWTFTPFTTLSADSVPLKIAGAPVVIPVESRFPLLESVSPPKDPCPTLIDPRKPIGLPLIMEIVRQFDNVLGFYVLINGMLQIQVPKEFDIAVAMSKQPAKYGGLTVSYIHQSMDATAFKILGLKIDLKPAGTVRPPHIMHNDSVGVRKVESKSRNGRTGRVGLLLTKEANHYLTVPTHLITQELQETRSSRGPFGWSRSTNAPYLSGNWEEDMEPCLAGEKIGKFVRTFDQEAREYPSGFRHDVSLFKPIDESVISQFLNPLENLGWLSESAWNSLRSGSEPIHILERPDPPESVRRTQVLPNVEVSDCQIIGTGIRINYESFQSNVKTVNIDIIQKAVSECLLYRVSPNFSTESGNSGIVVWAEGRREDGTVGRGVVGFQSFEQKSNFAQPSINALSKAVQQRLEDGRIAFYGSFKVPPQMKEEYEIV